MRALVAVLVGCGAACGRVGFDRFERLDAPARDAPGQDAANPLPDAPPITGVYVANSGADSVTFYPDTAVGDAAPLRTISGATTGIAGPEGLFVDLTRRELYVANFFGVFSIRVFPLDAAGDVAPIRALVDGPASRLFQVRKAIVDLEHDELIAISLNGAIRVYPRTADGDVAPLREIAGAGTLIDNPIDLAFDPVADELYINSYAAGGANVPGVLVFDRTASGNVPPKRAITGAQTQFGTYTNFLALDVVNRELLAQSNSGTGVVVFDLTADGDMQPKRNLRGAATGLANSGAMLVDPVTNRIAVVNRTANEIRVFPRDAIGDVAPLMILAGPATGLAEPHGLAIDGPTAFTGP